MICTSQSNPLQGQFHTEQLITGAISLSSTFFVGLILTALLVVDPSIKGDKLTIQDK